jgi:hypothetical protein
MEEEEWEDENDSIEMKQIDEEESKKKNMQVFRLNEN